MNAEEKRLSTKISILEDMLLREKNFQKALSIRSNLMALRKALGKETSKMRSL